MFLIKIRMYFFIENGKGGGVIIFFLYMFNVNRTVVISLLFMANIIPLVIAKLGT